MGITGNLVRSVRSLDDGKIKKVVPIRYDTLPSPTPTRAEEHIATTPGCGPACHHAFAHADTRLGRPQQAPGGATADDCWNDTGADMGLVS